MDEKEYNPDIVTVEDEQGVTHTFEVADAIETDEARYLALIPVYDDPEDILSDDGEFIIVEVTDEEDGGAILSPIEDPDIYDDIANIFEERLQDLYEIKPLDLEQ